MVRIFFSGHDRRHRSSVRFFVCDMKLPKLTHGVSACFFGGAESPEAEKEAFIRRAYARGVLRRGINWRRCQRAGKYLLSSEAREMSRLGGIISEQATTSKWSIPRGLPRNPKGSRACPGVNTNLLHHKEENYVGLST